MSAARAFSTALRASAPRAPIAARVAGIRSYAAAAPATGAANKPPVALFGVDGTYASALVRLPGNQLAEKEMLEDGIREAMVG
jgi:F-type H+-transporting ATPase subunit O